MSRSEIDSLETDRGNINMFLSKWKPTKGVHQP